MEVVGLGVGDFHYDIHKDSETAGLILSSVAGRDDNNVVGIDDEEDDGHGCGAADCSDLQVQSVDRELPELLVEPLGPHVLHSLRQGTFPWADEYA